MVFEGALIKEQGITFAIVIVKSHVLNHISERESIRKSFTNIFKDAPVVLMAQNSRGIPTYQGRKDLVNFLVNISISSIPWKKYTLN